MAKKKTTQQKNPTQTQPKNPDQVTSSTPQTHKMEEPISAMEDPVEKLSTLKNLNALLLKETVEKRQEVCSLLDSNKSLQSELTRSESEIESLRAELVRAEVGKEVVTVFVGAQAVAHADVLRREKEGIETRLDDVERERDEIGLMKKLEIEIMEKLEIELKDEIERQNELLSESIREKDSLKSEIDALVEEREELRAKVNEIEGERGELVEELVEMKLKFEAVSKELEEREMNVGLLRVELGLVEKKCRELEMEIEGLNTDKVSILRERDELVNEGKKQDGKISELESELDDTNRTILVLRNNEEESRAKLFELEKSNAELVEKVEGLESESRTLLEEKKEKEIEIESLNEEKMTAMKNLDDLKNALESTKRAKEEIIEDRNGLERVKLRHESEIIELQNKVSELENLKNALERANLELNETKKSFEEEKTNGASLQVKLSAILKEMEETLKTIDGLRASENTLVFEKKELIEKYNRLTEDKASVLKELHDAQTKITELESSKRSKNYMLELALTMLKNTAVQLSMASEKNGESEGIDMNNEEEMKPYSKELEVIRAAFRTREDKVGEMLQQMEKLQFSVVEAKKKKSFWTAVSSATTILAAVLSFAYAAKVR